MSLNTYPYNPFPASTDKLDEAHNAELQQEVDQLKEDTGELHEDVEKLETDKTDTAVIAPEFDAEAGVYAVGDLVMYQGKLYEFTAAHETAGDWDPTEVTEKTVADEIGDVKSGLTNLTTTVSKVLTQAFTADQGITLDSTPGYVYMRGNSVTVHLKATGNATVGANGMLVLGVLGEQYRPSKMETIAACAYNPLTTGQRYSPAVVRVETNGTCSLVTGLNGDTIGNTSYPWSTTLGIKFTFELN